MPVSEALGWCVGCGARVSRGVPLSDEVWFRRRWTSGYCDRCARDVDVTDRQNMKVQDDNTWVLGRWGGMWHRAKTRDAINQLYNAYCGHSSHYVRALSSLPGERDREASTTSMCTACLLAHVRVQGKFWGQSVGLPSQWHLIVDKRAESDTVLSACGDYPWRPTAVVADIVLEAEHKCPRCVAYLVEVPLFERDPFADDLL